MENLKTKHLNNIYVLRYHMINKNILNNCHKEGFEEEEIYSAYKIFFGTLVSEPRLKIINLLKKGEKNVSEIMDFLKMDQTSASHNLARLKECGFVNVEIKGKYRCYTLNETTIQPLMSLIDEHMSKNCIHILKRMK
jgi:ArsR family transcriptional regulator, cadmium/lead-responsive transcriptional repressor